MKNAEKIKILGITVNDLQFLFDNNGLNYYVCIASTDQIIDKGSVLHICDPAYRYRLFIKNWLNAESDNFNIPEDLIKEYSEKQEASKHKETVNESCNKTEHVNTDALIIKLLKEQNNILKSIDNHLDKLV